MLENSCIIDVCLLSRVLNDTTPEVPIGWRAEGERELAIRLRFLFVRFACRSLFFLSLGVLLKVGIVFGNNFKKI